MSDIFNYPLDAAGKLLAGSMARRAAGRLATTLTRRMRGSPTLQRSLIFAAETLTEGMTYQWWEEHVSGRVPRKGRGYLQPRFGDIVEALLVASLSAAAASWASREALSRTVVVPAGRTLYTYGTAAKIKALQALGIPAKTYLTSAYEVSASRVREILALPGEAEVVAIVDITSPAAFLWRPIAADFGRSGGGDEFITKAHLSFSEARIRAIHSLVRPPEIAALPSAPIQSRRDLLDAQTLPLERRETPTDLMGWRK